MKTQSQRIGFFINKIFICDMLKRIPKSDISIRPFKAYKNWSFDENSTEITLLEANVSSSELSGLYPKNSIYGTLRSAFYNGNEDNPFYRLGSKTNLYDTSSAGERYLGSNAKILSIPNIYVGEGIKKGSLLLNDASSGKIFIDDNNGNLIDSSGDSVNVSSLIAGFDTGSFNQLLFEDINGVEYHTTFLNGLDDMDIQNDILTLKYEGNTYEMQLISFDINTGKLKVKQMPFLIGSAADYKVGNVFYNQGILVITKDVEEILTASFDLSYKSTQTIYEHEYLLIVNKDEFNVSQNPSAIVEVGKETEKLVGSDGKIYQTITKPGVKYIRKKSILDNGNELDYRFTSSVNSNKLAGFEHYDLSGSMDSTGSFLAPFITTIGLYDDDMDLVAVAKLPQPIKSEPDIPVNFIIRFDT